MQLTNLFSWFFPKVINISHYVNEEELLQIENLYKGEIFVSIRRACWNCAATQS